MAVVGASGVVFGLAGATVADMALNFESLGRPVRHCMPLWGPRMVCSMQADRR